MAREMAHLAPGGGSNAQPRSGPGASGAVFQAMSFEVAVGNSNDSMRLALAFERKLPEIAASARSETARWFSVLGDPPTRRVLETALGLPKEFTSLDIDEQLQRLRAASQKRFGTDSIAELVEPERLDQMTQRFSDYGSASRKPSRNERGCHSPKPVIARALTLETRQGATPYYPTENARSASTDHTREHRAHSRLRAMAYPSEHQNPKHITQHKASG